MQVTLTEEQINLIVDELEIAKERCQKIDDRNQAWKTSRINLLELAITSLRTADYDWDESW